MNCTRHKGLVCYCLLVIILNFGLLVSLHHDGIPFVPVDGDEACTSVSLAPNTALVSDEAKKGLEKAWWMWGAPEQAERVDFLNLLLEFEEFAKLHELGWSLFAGTLLGSVRHRSLIPWDEDSDIIAEERTRELLLANEQYFLQRNIRISPFWPLNGRPVKLSRADRPTIGKYNWSWPYLDIFFYRTGLTRVVPVHEYHGKSRSFPKNDWFPLRSMCFEGHAFPVPADPVAVLDSYFQDPSWKDDCVSGKYNHITEKGTKKAFALPCSELKPAFPFWKDIYQNRVLEIHAKLEPPFWIKFLRFLRLAP